MGYPPGYQVHLAERAKEKVRIPVATISKIKHPELAEKILTEGKADMVSMGRALIADPDLVLKSERNEVDRIIPCISCNHCLDRIIDGGKPLRCSVNPLTGREYHTRLVPATRARKILVVGGGPAGMQAAVVAASRGHRVTLLEKKDHLGGQMLLAAKPPDKEEIASLTNYLSGELQKNGVDVRMQTEATPEMVEGMNPEVVITAPGALPLIPSLPGIELDHVVSAWETLRDPESVANNVVIIGGGMVGCDVACFLSSRGKQITIVEQLDGIGLDIGPGLRRFEIERLKKAGVAMMTKARAQIITQEGVVIEESGMSKVLPAETVVIAVGARSDRGLLEALESKKMEVHAIGDCVAPRRIVQAVSQGFHVGCWV
jgi:NADPH-dependent 2,4-dienoyl-CoA reductase/sulfur reductase-like enzyme